MIYYLAVDIGASSGRHIVGWLEEGKLKTEEVYRFSNCNEQKAGHLIWNAEKLFEEVKNGLKRAKEIGKIPSYIGIDTWAVDYALLDKAGERIGDIYAYRGSRTEKAIKEVHKIVPFEELYACTGIQFQPFNSVYQLYADKLSGRIDNAESMLMLPDYLNYCLTGVKKQEYTNATSTGLVNAQTHDWDRELIAKLGLPDKLFGELSQPGTTVGELSEEMQKEIGYHATVVLPATHDTASAVLAAPIDEASPYISSGTWSLLGIEQEKAHTDEKSRKANYSNEGSINFNFRYQKNIMGLWLIQSVRNELIEKPSFATLEQMARCKESEFFIDVNDNRFLSPDSMIEEIRNTVGKPLSLAGIMRVIYDSLAKSYAQAIKELERNMGKTYDTLHIIGGGSKDTFLNELTAKATGKKVVAGPTEATAIGNLIMQMIGTGELEDLSGARQIVKTHLTLKRCSMYELAKKEYAEYGVDTEAALMKLKEIPVSIHCWQGDDVVGLDGGGALSGGIQTTGNYPGRARNFEELKADIKKAFALMPGTKRLNLHASYAVGSGCDRDKYEPKHFAEWVKFAKELGLQGIDFNPTMFSHKNVKDGLTLSSPDETIRKFWVEHCKACLKIAEYFANEMDSHCLVNIWIPDGFKDVPADRLTPRLRLKKSLDEILSVKYDKKKVIVAVESKVFGIGVESYTVGSNEFYQNYAAKNDICCLLDNGHYHPLEYVSDKIPALLAFYDKVALHVTRGVRWDSDHVVLFEDELKEIAKEIVRNDATDKVLIGLDYFDASINRLSAWVTGQRAMQKALLYALLMNHDELKALQDKADFTTLMVKQEEVKDLPFGAVWKEYLKRENLSEDYLTEIKKYEKEELSKR